MEANFLERYYESNISWVYVGMSEEIPNKRDYLVFKSFNRNIFIQNNGNEFVSYSNICLHRSASIFLEDCGNGHPICPYHGWFYKNGQCKQSNEQLKQYDLEQVGSFLFVNISEDNIPLEEYLGRFYKYLEQVSSNYKVAGFMKEHLQIKASVNLVLENVLECEHCTHVHSDSLGPIGMGLGQPHNHETHLRHDKISYPLVIPTNRRVPREISESRQQSHNYDHLFVYPNLLISITNNEFVYIARVDSETENDITHIFARGMLIKDLDPQDRKVNAFYSMAWRNTIKVLNEDKLIVEDQFRNFKIYKSNNNHFNKGENRIINQINNYYGN